MSPYLSSPTQAYYVEKKYEVMMMKETTEAQRKEKTFNEQAERNAMGYSC